MFVCQTHDEEIVRGTRKSRIFDRGFLQAPIDLPHPSLRKHFRCEIHPIDLRHTFRSEPTSSSSSTAREIETLPRLWPPYRVDSLEDSYVQQTGHGRFIGVRPLGIANLWRNRWVLPLIEDGEVHVRFSTRTYLKTSELPQEDANGRELHEAEEVPGVVLPANQ